MICSVPFRLRSVCDGADGRFEWDAFLTRVVAEIDGMCVDGDIRPASVDILMDDRIQRTDDAALGGSTLLMDDGRATVMVRSTSRTGGELSLTRELLRAYRFAMWMDSDERAVRTCSAFRDALGDKTMRVDPSTPTACAVACWIHRRVSGTNSARWASSDALLHALIAGGDRIVSAHARSLQRPDRSRVIAAIAAALSPPSLEHKFERKKMRFRGPGKDSEKWIPNQ